MILFFLPNAVLSKNYNILILLDFIRTKFTSFLFKKMLLCMTMQYRSIEMLAKSAQIYCRYLNYALIEIYLYYTSPSPIQIILKKIALANRAIRVLWAPPSPGRKPLDQETIELIIEIKKLNPGWGVVNVFLTNLPKLGIEQTRIPFLNILKFMGSANLHNQKY